MINYKEKVTIVIVSHNNGSTIKKAIESATNGIRPADRIIIGDNDSTDNTYRVLCDMLGAKPITIKDKTGLPPQFDGEINNIPVTIFRRQKGTTSHTINMILQMGHQGTTIFGFMDPSSYYAPDKIHNALQVFSEQSAVACVVSDCDNHYVDGTTERVFRQSFDMQRLLISFPYDRNFLVRIQVFPKLQSGFNDQLSDMDHYDFMLRVAEIGLIYHTPAPLHHNIVRELSVHDRKAIEHFTEVVRQLAAKRRDQNNG